MIDDKLPLAMFVGSPEYPLLDGSAPDRFAQRLAEAFPDWCVEPPDPESPDLYLSASAPAGLDRHVAITADGPGDGGYRAVDEWRVSVSGAQHVAVELTLYHDAGPAEFAVVFQHLQVAWALPTVG